RRRQVVLLDPAVPHGAEQLLDEQGDPFRALEYQLDELAVGAPIEDRLDLGADFLGAESFQLEPLHRALLLPTTGHAPERMRAMQLVEAHRADQQRAARQPADE